MSEIDLSNLKLVEEVIDVADDSQYVDATEFGPPLPEGVYTFTQGKPAFSATDAGFLSAEMNHKVAGGEEDGKPFNFDRISNKPFERQGVKVNMMKDHLRALGDRAAYRTHSEYATAIAAGEGKPFQAQVTWEGGCNHEDTQFACDWKSADVVRVKGARNFGKNGAGQPNSEVKCEKCGKAIQARAKISRRIAAA